MSAEEPTVQIAKEMIRIVKASGLRPIQQTQAAAMVGLHTTAGRDFDVRFDGKTEINIVVHRDRRPDGAPAPAEKEDSE